MCKIDNYELKKGILNEDSQLQPSSVLAYIPQTPWSSHNYEDTIEDIKEVSKCDIRPKPSVKCSDMDNMINDCQDPNRWEPGFACIYDTSTQKCSLLNDYCNYLQYTNHIDSVETFCKHPDYNDKCTWVDPDGDEPGECIEKECGDIVDSNICTFFSKKCEWKHSQCMEKPGRCLSLIHI